VTLKNSIPKFSIVIPTRNRPQLCEAAVRSILQQSYANFEILVLENSDSEFLSQNGFQHDPRVRLLPSGSVLSMPNNWERALEFVRGEFVAFVSDKDRFISTALSTAAKAIADYPFSVFNYRKAWYESTTETLDLQKCSNSLSVHQTSGPLNTWFDAVIHMHNAPMIYSSFVRTDLVRRVQNIHGRFFWGTSPDVGSGILLTAMEQSYVLIDSVLSVAHSGDWSNGNAFRNYGDRHESTRAFMREYGGNPIRDLGLPPTISTGVAEVLYRIKAAFPELFAAYHINWRRCISNAMDEIQARKVPDSDKKEDIAFLLNHPYMKNRFTRLLVYADRWARGKYDGQNTRPLFPERVARRFIRKLLPHRTHRGCWDDTCYLPSVQLPTIDDAVRYLESNNPLIAADK
jgi:glycosyltransferase involved in cell wall biosynthesis